MFIQAQYFKLSRAAFILCLSMASAVAENTQFTEGFAKDLALAEQYLEHGHFPKVEKILRPYLMTAENLSPQEAGLLKLTLGRVYSLSTRCGGSLAETKQQAYALLSDALELARTRKWRQGEASALFYLGILTRTKKQYQEAADLFYQAHALAENSGQAYLSAQALLYGVHAASFFSSSLDIQTVFDKIEALPADSEKARLFLRTVQLLEALLTREQTYHLLQQTIALAKTYQNTRLLAGAYGHLSLLYVPGRLDEALHLMDMAIFFAQEASAQVWLFRWQYQKGRLLRLQQRHEAALKYYQQAQKSLTEELYQDISTVYQALGQGSFYDWIAPMFLEMADLYLHQARQNKEQRLSLLSKAKEIMETLKAYELRDYFSDPCVDEFHRRTKTVESLLDGNTAVVYPIMLEDRLELLVTWEKKQITAFMVDVSRRVLSDTLRRFHQELQEYSEESYRNTAEILYDWLIRPFKASLQDDIHTLVFVPEGALRTIPLAALYDKAETQFLIEQYALAITPALELTLQKKQRLLPGTISVLLGASKKDLNFAMDELDVIARLYRIEEELQGKDNALLHLLFSKSRKLTLFSKQEFKNALRGSYTLIHVASHALFQKNPRDSYIETHENVIHFDELEKALKNTLYHPDPAELLTLSACETAAGGNASGKAALGLSGITVKAGVRSALGALWMVQDQATYILMKRFYENLVAGMPKAQALQAAQRKLKEQPGFGHPSDWAPYVLVGNWR
ncbi:MAG: CHAT domain-containing protein [Gammaproteobacteria bacterium]|nr:CHAT domain-containing protein [Gammaproteobacteria bacterium]